MKVDVCLLLEATVICILAVCVVAPAPDGQSGPLRGVDNLAERPTGDAGPGSANNARPAAVPPTGSSNKPINTTVTPAVSPSPRPFTKGSQDNCTAVNGTDCNTDQSLTARLLNNKGMLQRAVYVLVGVTVVILVYFGLRTWSTRKRRSKAKKYGLITTPASDLEMAPLDQEDDDEDMTVFEVNGLHK